MSDTGRGKIDVKAAQKAYKAPAPDVVKAAPEEAKAKVKDTKTEHDAIDKVAKANARLAKDGSGNRMDVQMRADKPHVRWGHFVPTRELTEDELDAVETLK